MCFYVYGEAPREAFTWVRDWPVFQPSSPCGLHFPPRRRSCRFIPHLLCAADTAKQVQGSSFRERHVGKTERASRELTQAPGGQVRKVKSLLRPGSWSARTPGNQNKAGIEDGQKGSKLTWTGPQTRPGQTWTCCGTLSHVSRSYTAYSEGKGGGHLWSDRGYGNVD